jgi:hypothetical protein
VYHCLLICVFSSDLISSVSFNQVYPLLATCSGQRKFSLANDGSDDEDINVDDEELLRIDNSLKLWYMHGSWVTYESQQVDMEAI